MIRIVAVACLLIAWAGQPAPGQMFNHINLDRLNRRLSGRVVDHTANHGQDRRLCSPILGRKRDLYVYLPPGYDPKQAYPLILSLHIALIDEHLFIGSGFVDTLDGMIARGEFPPVVVACPDGSYEGTNRIKDSHSLYVNGLGGRFEDHVVAEVVPFVMRTYSILPGREAHAILGTSAGGYGGMALALKHRDIFGVVATLGGPLNMRYDTCRNDIRANFHPSTYRWKTEYDPDAVAATYYCGLAWSRAKKHLEAVYGSGPEMMARIARDNPADLIFTTDLRPGELAIYVNYPGDDNWNVDAHGQSFAWLAGQRGVAVTQVEVPKAQHTLHYFRSQQRPAYEWLARQLPPPALR